MHEPVLELRHDEVGDEIQDERDREQEQRVRDCPGRVIREAPERESGDDLGDEGDGDQAAMHPVEAKARTRLDHLAKAADQEQHADARDDRVERQQEIERSHRAMAVARLAPGQC